MIRIAKLLILFTTGMILISSCTDKNRGNAFDAILLKAPYAGLSDSIKRQPANDELYFRRAVLLNSNNLPELALADLKKAWSIKKDEKYAFGLGNLYLEKHPDSAIVFLEAALRELPNSFLLQLTLARALDEQKRTDEALKLCDAMLQKNPDQVDVLKMKADILDRKGNTSETITTLEKAYHLTPFDIELNYMLALKLAEAKNSRVIALCDSLIRADSMGTHAEPFYYKGIYYSNINEKAKALFSFNAAIKVNYNFLESYIEKGSLLYDMKKYEEALAVFNLCLTISPKFADVYYWIGKCQEAMGKPEEAKLNYQRAYSLDKNLLEAKTAAEKIAR